MDLEHALQVMEQAALTAGDEMVRMQPESVRLDSRKDFLSDADLASERIILAELGAAYPDIAALSEEQGGERLAEGYLWVVDPIDGTVNFFNQRDHWGVSIALVKDEHTVAAVVYLAGRREIFSATHGGVRGRRIGIGASEIKLTLNRESRLSESQFIVGWGKNDAEGKDHEQVLALIDQLDRVSLYPLILNSTVADVIDVCVGRATGYIHLKPESFDIAAVGLILQQAGGTVTDREGKPWSPFASSFVASNGAIHADLLRIVNKKNGT